MCVLASLNQLMVTLTRGFQSKCGIRVVVHCLNVPPSSYWLCLASKLWWDCTMSCHLPFKNSISEEHKNDLIESKVHLVQNVASSKQSSDALAVCRESVKIMTFASWVCCFHCLCTVVWLYIKSIVSYTTVCIILSEITIYPNVLRLFLSHLFPCRTTHLQVSQLWVLGKSLAVGYWF